MSDMDEIFKKECEELGIDYSEFPYEFSEDTRIYYPIVFAAMMWILKKRQDKLVGVQEKENG